jgi:hypothetical protein
VDEYPHLRAKFLAAMNDIGRYGLDKYGENSFEARAMRGDTSRGPLTGRTSSRAIKLHIEDHYQMYMDKTPHDHFGTHRHQLAAVAFNAMMEFYFEGLEDEL